MKLPLHSLPLLGRMGLKNAPNFASYEVANVLQ
jgi:hypothetical protein